MSNDNPSRKRLFGWIRINIFRAKKKGDNALVQALELKRAELKKS